ncbi:MAG TPA: 1-deoxy-D-xylulose-5-phosphate synthase, partial [Candidatus Omnitrophica bacterium]|nr:1-deoxy-D-xylulose-5-phosphate synthase [Candidatus Omnitrophota bacterium]
DIELGRSEVLIKGEDLALLAYGSMVNTAYQVAAALQKENLNPYLVNLRFAKPLDSGLILDIAGKVNHILILEEGSFLGGIAESISALLANNNMPVKIIACAIEDKFVTYGSRSILLNIAGLDKDSIVNRIKTAISEKTWQR